MIRLFLVGVMSALLIVAAAFLWFVQSIPSAPNVVPTRTDAIIVLTGGKDRVERGLEALAKGESPVLLISGVGEKVTRTEMLMAHATPEIRAAIERSGGEIVLDYVASTTRSNADQTTEFVRERRLRSIRLVTASYHMPRSMLEFRIQMPDVKIVPDPVFPRGFKRHNWWRDEPTRHLVLSEFGKYFAALFLRTRIA